MAPSTSGFQILKENSGGKGEFKQKILAQLGIAKWAG